MALAPVFGSQATAAFHGCGLTPELSRHAERARRWDNPSASAEPAKRARLERIVRQQLLRAAKGVEEQDDERSDPADTHVELEFLGGE